MPERIGNIPEGRPAERITKALAAATSAEHDRRATVARLRQLSEQVEHLGGAVYDAAKFETIVRFVEAFPTELLAERIADYVLGNDILSAPRSRLGKLINRYDESAIADVLQNITAGYYSQIEDFMKEHGYSMDRLQSGN